MRPPEVSTTDILDAGRRLIEEGKTVNGWSLRRAVGDRGKAERLIAEWQRAQAEATPEHAPQAPPAAVVLPPVIAEAVDQARLEFTARFDGIIVSLFRMTDETLKSRYKSDFDRLSAERTQMEDNLATASASTEATEERLTDALADAADQRARLLTEEKTHAVTAERLRSVEAAFQADAAAAKTQITQLEEQVRTSAAAAQKAQQTQAAAEATAAAAERDADRLRAQVADLTTALDAAKAEATDATQKAQRAQAVAEATAAATERDADRLRTQVADLATALDATKAEAADGKVMLATVAANLDAQRDRADRTEADLGRVRQERDAAQVEVREQTARAAAAEQRATMAEDALKRVPNDGSTDDPAAAVGRVE